MRRRTLFASALLVLSALAALPRAHAQEGMLSVPSPHDVPTTVERLETALAGKGMTVFARIDHADGAEQAGLPLPPTEVIVFGNPEVGTPLMQCRRSIAIDLPQKMLVWEDESGATRVGWNDPAYLRSRHGIEGCDEELERVSAALEAFAKAATAE